jgi:hypothetical protein
MLTAALVTVLEDVQSHEPKLLLRPLVRCGGLAVLARK